MSRIAIESADGAVRMLDAIDGWSVMEILRAHKLPVSAICAGTCSCGTCHVIVSEDWTAKLPPPSDDENELLDTLLTRQANSRLACQLIFNGEYEGLRLRLA